MRRDDLKNRLNNEPIVFDQEALWRRISKKPKRRKPLIYWWISGMGLGILGLHTFHFINDHSHRGKSTTVEYINEEKKLDTVIKLERVIVDESLNSAKINQSLITPPNLEGKYTSVDEIRGKEELSQTSSEDFNSKETKRKISEQRTLVYTQQDDNVDEGIRTDKVTPANYSEEMERYLLNIRRLGKTKKIKIEWSRTRPQINCNPKPLFTNPTYNDNTESLVFSFGVNSGVQSFEKQDQYKRHGIEKNRIGVNSGIAYTKGIFDRMSIEIGINLLMLKSMMDQKGELKLAFLSTENQKQTILVERQNRYKIYNELYYLQPRLSWSYKAIDRNWSIVPHFGFGLDFVIKNNASVIINSTVAKTSELRSYKEQNFGMFIVGGLRLERHLSTDWRIGVNFSTQTRRKIDSDNSHRFMPVNLDFFFSKQL